MEHTEKEFWLVEFAVAHEPSHLDQLMRGKLPTGPIRGSITTRRDITESLVVTGHSRGDALSEFRKYSGMAIASIKPVSAERALSALTDMEREGTDSRLRLPGDYVSELRQAALAARKSRA